MGTLQNLGSRRSGRNPAVAAETRWRLLAERTEQVAGELDAAVLAALAQGRYRRGLAALHSEVQGLRVAIESAVGQRLAVAAIYDEAYAQGLAAARPGPARTSRRPSSTPGRDRRGLYVAGGTSGGAR